MSNTAPETVLLNALHPYLTCGDDGYRNVLQAIRDYRAALLQPAQQPQTAPSSAAQELRQLFALCEKDKYRSGFVSVETANLAASTVLALLRAMAPQPTDAINEMRKMQRMLAEDFEDDRSVSAFVIQGYAERTLIWLKETT